MKYGEIVSNKEVGYIFKLTSVSKLYFNLDHEMFENSKEETALVMDVDYTCKNIICFKHTLY